MSSFLLKAFVLSLVFFQVVFSSGTVWSGTYASFTSGNTFLCNGNLFFQEFTTMNSITLTGSTGSVAYIADDGASLNGIGFSINESLIYGVDTSSGTVYKVNNQENLFAMSACTYPSGSGMSSSQVQLSSVNRGDVDPNGIFWVMGTYNGQNTLFALDLVTNPTGCLIVYQDDRKYFLPEAADFSFVPLDGSIYSFDNGNNIQRIQILSHIYANTWNGYDNLPIPSGQSSSSAELYGITSNSPSSVIATFVTPENIVIAYDSSSTELIAFNITQITSSSSTVAGTVVETVSGGANRGDGASCPYLLYTSLDTSNPTPTVEIPFYLTAVINNEYLSTLNPLFSITFPSGIYYTGGTITYTPSSASVSTPASYSVSGNVLSFSSMTLPSKATLSIKIPVNSWVTGSKTIQGSSTNLPANLGNSVLTNWPGTTVPFSPTPVNILAPVTVASNVNGTITNATTVTYLTQSTSNPTATVYQNITIKDNGAGNLLLSSIVLPPGFTLVNPPANGTIVSSGSSITLQVAYTPGTSTSGNIVIITNDPAGNLTLPLTGLTLVPQISVTSATGAQETSSVSNVDFGTTTVGTPVSQTLNIQNIGGTTLNINSLNLPATVTAKYVVGGVSYSSTSYQPAIAPSSSIQLVLTYNPTVLGSLNGNLVINSNSNLYSAFSLSLTGKANGPLISVTDPNNNQLSNGSLETIPSVVLATPTYETITVTNNGNATLNLTNVGITGTGYSIASGPSTTSLAPGQSTTLQVEIYPQNGLGVYNGTLVINSNDNSQNTINIGLTANATGPLIAVSNNGNTLSNGTTVNFTSVNEGQNSVQTVVITNNGNSNLNLNNLTVSGTGYSIVSGPSVTVLAPGQSTSVQIQLNSNNPGTYNGSLTVNSNDNTQNSLTFPISGTVLDPVFVASNNGNTVTNGSTVTFPNTPVGTTTTQTIVVSNTGNQNLNISSITIPPGYYYDGGSISSSGGIIPPGGSGTIILAINSTNAQVVSGQLVIVSNDPKVTQTNINLTGVVGSGSISASYPNSSGGNTALANSPNSNMIVGYAFVNTTLSKVLTLSNTGTTYLYVYNTSLPSGVTFTKPIPSYGLAIAPGSSVNIVVSIDTSKAGVFQHAISLPTSDPYNNPFQFSIVGYVYQWYFTTPKADGTSHFYMYLKNWIRWEHDIGNHHISLSLVDSTGKTIIQTLSTNYDGTLLSYGYTPSQIVPKSYKIKAVLTNIADPNLSQYNGKTFFSQSFDLTP